MYSMTRLAYFEAEGYFVGYIAGLDYWMTAPCPQDIRDLPVQRWASKAAFEATQE